MGAPAVSFVAKIILSVGVDRGHNLDTDQLKRQIVEADIENPWVVVFNGSTVRSMRPIDKITTHELHTTRRYVAEVWPYLPVTLNQLHAYNRYANQLAANLAKMLKKENGVGFVDVTIELESSENRHETSQS